MPRIDPVEPKPAGVSDCDCDGLDCPICEHKRACESSEALEAWLKLNGDRDEAETGAAGGADMSKEAEPAARSDRAFPLHVLPEALRGFVTVTARTLCCDESVVALPLLTGMAAAIGTTRRIRLTSDWTEPCIFWTAMIIRSGGRKSPALDKAIGPLKEWQEGKFNEYKQQMAMFEQAQLHHQVALGEWKTKGHKKGENPPTAPTQPHLPEIYVVDTTTEALADILQRNPRGLILVADELSGWFGSFNKYHNAKRGDEAHWLSFFGARPVKVNRKTGDRRVIYVPVGSVSVTGCIQTQVLKSALSGEYMENGLAARFLMTMPAVLQKRFPEREVGKHLIRKIGSTYAKLLRLKHTEGDGKPEAVDLKLTAEAQGAFAGFVNRHGKEEMELDDHLAAVWSKLECYAARFALLFHLIRWAMGENGLSSSGPIDKTSVEAAITVVRWFADQVDYIYSVLLENEGQKNRRELVELIRKKGGRMSARQLMHSKSEYRSSSKDAEKALDDLVEAGLGEWQHNDRDGKGGRPSKDFVLSGAVTVTEPTGRNASADKNADGNSNTTSPPEDDGDPGG